MDQTPQQHIEAIVRHLEEEGRPSDSPLAEAFALATSHPDTIHDFAMAAMQRFPKGDTLFLDGAFSFMPDEQWPELVKQALDMLESSSDTNEAAESVIAYASLQAPTALHAHLSRIFNLEPNKGSYYEFFPWRESGEQHFSFLRNVIEDTSSDRNSRRRAWSALCETRHPEVIEYALSVSVLDGIIPDDWSEEDEWVPAHIHYIGYCQEIQGLRNLCRGSLYHFQFPETFFEDQSSPPWLARIHPSWNLPASHPSVPFGGMSESCCSRCGEAVHRLMVLDPIPPRLGITGLTRLELATCLSCLDWEEPSLFYRHHPDGSPVHIGYDGPLTEPQFPAGPLKEAQVGLAETPRRWYWQDWALSNGRENLNRLGGEPCWIQNAEYPECPSCGKLMTFLLQLDSDLPTSDGEEWLWGSGGIGYGFWCDSCKVSGFLVQGT